MRQQIVLGAEKGEGVAGYQAEYDAFGGRYCRAPGANGGGGGCAHNGGGGGGANAPNSSSNSAYWSGNGILTKQHRDGLQHGILKHQ